MKILVVDDAMVMRNIHKNILKEHSISENDLLEAENGEKALKLAIENKIDLFLLDWNMPKLNGLELVKKIRSIKHYQKTPIIMITAEAARYNIIDAIEAGVTNYVVKPIKGNVLWEKISKYIKCEEKV
jgi:two-component system chemotaxis response regulator CheY